MRMGAKERAELREGIMSGAVEGVALQDAVTTLDVWLAAYATKPDTWIALPDHDDDLLTFGHLRTILAALTTPPARSYADGVEDAAKLAEVERDASAVAAEDLKGDEGAQSVAAGGYLSSKRIAAAIRLLSQGGKA